MPESKAHKDIKNTIVHLCYKEGLNPLVEERVNDWIADVFVEVASKKIAFEVQISNQTYKKTKERQDKYIRDNVLGCWLFKKPPHKFRTENPNLPVFRVTDEAPYSVELVDGRKSIPLEEFIPAFLNNEIKYCETTKAKENQKIDIVFFQHDCWKCKAINHVYYLKNTYISSCNFEITENDIYYNGWMWNDEKPEFFPEIIAEVNKFKQTSEGSTLRIKELKKRYSNTVEDEYLSFGCIECDAIFGDWYISEALIDVEYGHNITATHTVEVTPNLIKGLEIPHWCYPDNGKCCCK